VGLEAGLAEDGVVVAPGGVRHVHIHSRVVLGEELGGDTKGARARQRLAHGNLLVLDQGRILAKDNLPQTLVVNFDRL